MNYKGTLNDLIVWSRTPYTEENHAVKAYHTFMVKHFEVVKKSLENSIQESADTAMETALSQSVPGEDTKPVCLDNQKKAGCAFP